MSETVDMVNHPPHYRSHPSGEQCVTFAEWLGFNVGDAFKYIWRRDAKGARAQDLGKSLWYLDRALAHPATVPHRRPADLPVSVLEAWDRVYVLTVTPLDHVLCMLWQTQFAGDPADPLTRARCLVSLAIDQSGDRA